MNGLRTAAAVFLLAGLGACAQTPPIATVTDPYAGSRYTGTLPGGTLPGASAEDFRRIAGDTVWFPENDAALDGRARETLVRQAGWLKQNGSFSTVIEGHADEQGTREYNLALGARRASAVQEYLVSQGVDRGRIRTSSYGKERPFEICSDPACQAQNRRAVTVVAPGPGV